MQIRLLRKLGCSTVLLGSALLAPQSEQKSFREKESAKSTDQCPCAAQPRQDKGKHRTKAPPRKKSQHKHPVNAPPLADCTIYLHFGKDKLDGYVEYRPIVEANHKEASISAPVLAGNIQISVNGQQPQKGQIEATSQSEGVLRVSLRYTWPDPRPTNPYHLRIAGLLPQNIQEIRLTVTLAADSDTHLDSILPGNWSPLTPSSFRTENDRSSIRFDKFWEDSIIIGLQTKKSTLWPSLQNSPAAAYVITQILALIVLLVTMSLKGYLILKAVQKNELHRIGLRLLQIETDPTDQQPKSDLITYIKELQTRPDYAAFHRKFTDPLDEILRIGLTNNVARYRECVARMKTRLRMSWVLFH